MSENPIHQLLRIAAVMKAHKAVFGSDARWFAECLDRLRLNHHNSFESAFGIDVTALREWKLLQRNLAILRFAEHIGPYGTLAAEENRVAADLQDFARRRHQNAYRLSVGISYKLLADIFAIDSDPPQSPKHVGRCLENARTFTHHQMSDIPCFENIADCDQY